MAEASILVDLTNPGQVFACLGFLEAADILCGDAEGGFDWSNDANVKFAMKTDGEEHPFAAVLSFLASVEVRAVAPVAWRPKKEPEKESDKKKLQVELDEQENSDEFPGKCPDTITAMPVQIVGQSGESTVSVTLGHWADGSSRDEFKLYSGNRTAREIVRAMLTGTREKPRRRQNRGDLKTKGVAQLWEDRCSEMIDRPFDVITPMGGSFNFDPRGAWTAIGAGYSPNDQDHQVEGSPVVEILAAWGLENARPYTVETRQVCYTAWNCALPLSLARVAVAGGIEFVPQRRFHFELGMSGKNKIVTFAQEESQPRSNPIVLNPEAIEDRTR